jgi:phosphate transport system permease protein
MPGAATTAQHDAAAGRRTSAWVLFQDRAAELVITAGGLAVLLAMLGICVFLVSSTVPLFTGGRLTGEVARFRLEGGSPLWVSLDPAFDRFITLDRDGVYRVRSITDGDPLAAAPALADAAVPGAVRAEAGEGWATLTGSDGSFVLTRPVLSWKPFRGESGSVVSGEPSGDSPEVYLQTLGDGSVRRWTLTIDRRGPFDSGTSGIVDSRGRSDRERSFASSGDSGILAGAIRSRRALGSSSLRFTVTPDKAPLRFDETPDPRWVFSTGSGRWVYAVWESGVLLALDREAGEGNGVSRARLPWPDATITAAEMGLGAESLLVGDSQGRLSVWSAGGDAGSLEMTSVDPLGAAPVAAIRPGDRDRTVAVGFGDGEAVLYNLLSGKTVVRTTGDGPAVSVAASPGSEMLLVCNDQGEVVIFGVEPGHAGVSFRSLFGKVKYEGYDEPEFVYQSTGSASSEPKFSLVPLIFGTIKATIVAMLFATPLGVLAAVYSSEFLHHGVRRVVKPAIELMASLPSVVLGFMAAMVVAPFVRDFLPQIMLAAATGPLGVVLAAHGWRSISRGRAAHGGPARQIVLIACALAGGIAAAVLMGPAVEDLLFAPGPGQEGSIRGWLNRDFGGPGPGWFVASLPVVALVLLIADAGVLDPAWRRFGGLWGDRLANAAEFFRLLVNLAVLVLVSAAVAWLLGATGLDPRDSIFGPFNQRNTLVVGMIMGIAVIPIIYTISEDAIRSVPDSLRSASLGVGATPWQTAVRVLLPVAGSGIFSACMIGLGRAVGETMIVLMATGNTPEMSWNIFSGFRTLAANIAVELPEAPRESTHYRVLFLCGLVLFAMTLVINTTGELVRQHFRKRNAAL